MKLIWFALTVSALAGRSLSVFVDESSKIGFFLNTKKANTVENELHTQRLKKIVEIIDSIDECNQTLTVPMTEAQKLWTNPPIRVMRMTRKPAKCFMDCVMRKQGVMTDNGFQVDTYIRDIKQLRYNYTLYDINGLEADKKSHVLEAIKSYSNTERYYEMILTYEWAAHECKDTKDEENDKCETSWRIARCMVNRSREKGFNNVFYPIQMNFWSFE